MRKKVAVIIFLNYILIASSFASAQQATLPQITPIYIREDGTIENSDGALQRHGNVYLLLNDINKPLEIQRNNILIDGRGFTINKSPQLNVTGFLRSPGRFPSILINEKINITIVNIKFENCYTGITITHSKNINLIQNSFTNSIAGICSTNISHSKFFGNNVTDNEMMGLNINDASYLDISFNTISRNRWHGAWLATSYSNISRNNIANNSFDGFGIGLYLYGPNYNNRIFENNFIGNEQGLFYQGSKGISFSNQVYNNYWDSNRDNIVNVSADSISGVDTSSSLQPNPIIFDSSLFPLPSIEPNPTPTPTDTTNPADNRSIDDPKADLFVPIFGTVSLIALAAVSVGLVVYFKKCYPKLGGKT
jgi:nitrous oxidase accessory protein NosD